jgi:hypothetical protein
MGLQVVGLAERREFGASLRRDPWWRSTALTAGVLLGFVGYATWAAFQNAHYHLANYLSPFYSPELFGDSRHAWFGPKPDWWPGWLPFSAAFLILWVPGGFRLTCYYYRGAYYKSIWMDPPACAVGEPRKSYRGEASLPLILQNAHRYFLYLAVPFLGVLTHDAWHAFWFDDPAGGGQRFGVGVGSLVLAVNVVLLGGYTFGCHSMRHFVGGYRDRISEAPFGALPYRCVSCMNRGHQRWAWASLFWVAFADVYIRLCSMGIWTDWRLF